MPALQRTPPQKAGKSPAKPYDRPAELIPEATASPARTPSKLSASATRPPAAAPTTPRAFLPWAQKVLRTPPDGMTASTSSMPPPPLPIQGGATTDIEELDNMDIEDVLDDRDKFVEEQITAGTSTAPRQSLYPTITVSAESQPLPISTETLISTTPTKSPQPRTSTTPVHSPPKTSGPTPLYPPSAEAGPSSQPAPATRASPPRTPRTRRTAAPVSIADPLPEIQVDETSEYGKRYELTMDTLQLAIKNAAMKWTDLEGIFPLLASKIPQELKQIHTDASTQMKARIESEAKGLFEHYRVGRAMQMLDAVVKDGQEYAASSSEVRADAWRPDLSPEALTAAANLGIYDEAYERLRTEYLALHADCSTRFSSIQAKQAQLAEVEKSVTDSVAELDETLRVLDGFPTGEMKDWAETTMGRMEGGRVVEKA